MLKDWFEKYVNRGIVSLPAKTDGTKYNCPCCQSPSLEERGAYEICDICGWEDDGQDEQDANVVWHGANKGLSLSQARENYRNMPGWLNGKGF